jgi:hypothetical protein
MKRKIFFKQKYLNNKKIVHINIHAHIHTDKLMHKDTFYR